MTSRYIRTTHTLATLGLSRAAYDEIARKLREAGYEDRFDDGLIDMSGIGILPPADPLPEPLKIF
jgi:hypothetical protein